MIKPKPKTESEWNEWVATEVIGVNVILDVFSKELRNQYGDHINFNPYSDLNNWALVMKRLEEIGKHHEYSRKLWFALINNNLPGSTFHLLTAPAEARMEALFEVFKNADKD